MPRPSNPQVRVRLLTAGLELIRANGFNGCGVKEITDHAGVPKGSFYSYYSSKDDFAVAVLEHYWVSIERDFGKHLQDESLAPLDRVSAFFRAMTEDNARRDFTVGCLVGNLALEIADHSVKARAKLAHIMDRWTARISACLREAGVGFPDGHGTAEDLAAALIEAWEGAVMQGRILQRRDPYDRFAAVVVPRLLGTPVARDA
ncbi:TetR family transcriptional regulator C-terminal domain-containing protein [Streptomyces sp. NPDC018964]|uniref:TetR/AcrR family transcriptional regulator n=1 Tax=unclassified Streptomyces TaxID=2593676 RepID=UPI003796D63B